MPRVITRLVGWAVAIFYDVERSGPRVPDGPVIVAANHPNALVDPLVIFHTAGRATRPLGKAPLFEQAIVGSVLRGLGGLPVYRREDDPELMHLNDCTFEAAIEALHAGSAIQIYPEGYSHSGPSLTPLRTGAARIALMAEERRGWQLGVKVQPVGLTYTRKHRFRGRAVALFGEPFVVAPMRDAYERDPRDAVRSLTAQIQRRLERLTLNLDHPEDAEVVDVAERLYAGHKKLTRARGRPTLVERMPRLQRFAEGVRWLRHTDPERLARLRVRVRRYLRLLTLFGASEGDVPTRYRLGPVLRYSAAQLVVLALVLPAAAVGAVLWLVPVLLTRHISPRFRPRLDQVASYKVGTALVAFPIWYVALAGAALPVAGVRGALFSLVVTPIAGLATIAWSDRQAVVREDMRVFLRAVRRSEARDRLREQRAHLVAELDALTEAWQADRARRPGEHEAVRPAL